MAHDTRAFKRTLLEESPRESIHSALGTQAIRFVFVKEIEDIAGEGVHPSFINNVFDGVEEFAGYEELDVSIFVTAGSLKHYVQITYEEKGDMDILALMKTNVYEDALLKDMEEFTKAVNEEFTPPGDIVHRQIQGNDTYEIYRSAMTTPGFMDYHQRLRTIPVWFIDGGSIVISSEPHWTYFTLFRRSGGKFVLVGMVSCYIYYQSLSKSRPRISQVLILPQYQRQGFGSLLLNTVYNAFRRDSSSFEITIEDCSVEMQFLRDLTDVKDVIESGVVQVRECRPGMKWGKNVILELKNRLKITENQLARANELIQYAQIDTKDSEAMARWRKAIKKRLYALNYEELRPKREQPDLKHIYIHDDSDSEMNEEMVQKLMEDVGPLQELSSTIADGMKQLAGQKRADRQYLSSSERLEKLQLYYEEQKAEYDPIREKVIQILKPFLDR